MQNETLKNNLIFISVNFSFIAQIITKLETKNMSLYGSMQIVELAIEKLKLVSEPIRDVVKKRKFMPLQTILILKQSMT